MTFVDESLAAMPEHLRAGVVAESLGLGTWFRLRARGRGDEERLRQQLHAWEHHPIDLIRQYVRMMESMVVLAEIELPGSGDEPRDHAPNRNDRHAPSGAS